MLNQSTDDVPDIELVARARRGDDDAFRSLVERYQDQVAATVIRMLGTGPEADDVGQETFIRFYHALDRFRGDSELGYYLKRIAMNLALNALKRRERRRSRLKWNEDLAAFSDPEMIPEQDLEGQEMAAHAMNAIQSLSPKIRAVAVLRLVEGYSTAETAELLGIPYGTVLSRLARAVRLLRDQLRFQWQEHD